MEARDATLAAGALVAFTFLSSLLGLTGRFVWMAPLDALGFMGGIWGQSVAADVVFTAGTLGAAILGWSLASQWSVIPAILLGGLTHWLVYGASFLMLPEGVEGQDGWGALVFVGAWGIVGLVFAALAPPLAARWWDQRLTARP